MKQVLIVLLNDDTYVVGTTELTQTEILHDFNTAKKEHSFIKISDTTCVLADNVIMFKILSEDEYYDSIKTSTDILHRFKVWGKENKQMLRG